MHCNYRSTFFEEQASLFFCFKRLSWVKSCLTMFLYCQFYFTSFFPSIFPVTKIVSEFLPLRNEVKNAHQMQSRWLMASLLHNDWFFLLPLARGRNFYVALRWANNDKYIFYIILQGSKQRQQYFVILWGRKQLAIAMCNRWLQEATTRIVFFMSYHDEQATSTTFFASYCKGASNDRDLYTSRGSKHTSGQLKSTIARVQGTVTGVWQWWPTIQQPNILYVVESARSNNNEHISCCIAREAMTIYFWCCLCHNNELTIARCKDVTIKHFTCCWLQGWQQQAYLGMSYCKKRWRRWLIASKEHKTAPCNNQLNICVGLQGSKQWLQRLKVPAMK